MAVRSTARLKITLLDVEPDIVRRIDVPLDISLDKLHLAIQAAMGWTNSHLWEFGLGRQRFGPPAMSMGFDDGPIDATKTALAELSEAARGKTILYAYDFGDGWEHELKIEKLFDAAPDEALPALVEAIGRCPPEDIGGPPGFDEFCEAIADPSHERHEELKEWYDGDWDPKSANEKSLRSALGALTKRWKRNSPAKKPQAKKQLKR